MFENWWQLWGWVRDREERPGFELQLSLPGIYYSASFDIGVLVLSLRVKQTSINSRLNNIQDIKDIHSQAFSLCRCSENNSTRSDV